MEKLENMGVLRVMDPFPLMPNNFGFWFNKVGRQRAFKKHSITLHYSPTALRIAGNELEVGTD